MKRKNKLKVIALVGGALFVLLLIWFLLTGVEKLVRDRRAEETDAQRETEAAESTSVQGSVKLDGKAYTYDHEFENWLFIGTDNSGAESATGEEYRGGMADFLLLAVVDKTDGNYAFLQINRETMTEVTLMQTDGSGYASAVLQICTSHWYGGNPEQSCENTVEAVSRLLGGLPIDGYYSMNMDDIAALNHAVGGVEVLVEDDFSKVDPTLKQGERILLNDEQAYNFLQNRMEIGDGDNEGRMRRQRQYMEAVLAKAKEQTQKDPSFANELYNEMEDLSVSSMKGRDISRLMKETKDAEGRGIYEIKGETRIGQILDDGIDHAEFYPDEGAVREVMTELYHLTEEE